MAERSRWRRWGRLWHLVRAALIAYLLVILVMSLFETWLVYPIPPVDRADWQPADLNFEDAWMAASDGTRLHGWFVPHPEPKNFLIYFHGNGEQVADNAQFVAELRDELAASVLIFDYRGYGRSDGSPHEAGLIDDGLAAQRWLSERLQIDTSDIVLMGRSIGAGVAVAVAAEKGARALVLENAFTRLTDVAVWHYPWIPVSLLMRNRYDCVARIAKYDGPLIQSHGTVDSIVPLELGRRLFDAAPSRVKTFIELPGLDHNDLPPPGYFRKIAKLLAEV